MTMMIFQGCREESLKYHTFDVHCDANHDEENVDLVEQWVASLQEIETELEYKVVIWMNPC